ncbi:MAG TPA: hypothetical protein VNO43_05460 [Candidatus Eisenbacteria bacterium]|nr:hypothetical protein [Candidatus Eisenbacteria bacterium]
MAETERKLFVGIKISSKLQSGLDSPAPGTERYFKENNKEYLQIIEVGQQKLIGRFVENGFPADEIENVSRNVRSIVRLIMSGQRLDDDAVHIYAP